MQNVLYAILVLGCMGAVFGLVLAIASKVFAVKTDERLEPLIEALPGANCGGCGFSGCAAYAQAVLEGKARIGKCAAGGKECADAMAKIMGQEPVEMERMVAMVTCHGVDAIPKGNYEGLRDCISASRVAGKGPMLCEFGCLGFGNCVEKCKFGALSIVDGRAHVDREKCKGCMSCITVCPRHIIKAVPYDATVTVPCSSKAKGPVVLKSCGNGCIGCMKCVKTCEHDAIKVTEFLASIDYSKCIGCGKCAEACPRHIIFDANAAAKQAAAAI